MRSVSDPDPDDDPPPVLHLRRRARLEDASALRKALVHWARAHRLSAALITDLELAVYEALVNSAEHAYPGDTEGSLDLHAHHEDQVVRVTVTDHGRWRPQPPPDPLRGRGVPLIHLLADHTDIAATEQGTTVTMTWQLSRHCAD
ncbi:ATP-binding protein [Amycolatopsis sp. FDAARGOS 1241]|uniref:ATP-binding protein n=1 Tax=Amycolatopsis sp. FDAARGOS 1241 TaxID=2778070 RepID=UPI00194F40F8|nr:ATP-binding protein [Amycolatopsis sp. FDAARGOS 1241]QRP49188.1 ATP-binding protein [Amycolatopsis sp. FDAARGOS 1241]